MEPPILSGSHFSPKQLFPLPQPVATLSLCYPITHLSVVPRRSRSGVSSVCDIIIFPPCPSTYPLTDFPQALFGPSASVHVSHRNEHELAIHLQLHRQIVLLAPIGSFESRRK